MRRYLKNTLAVAAASIVSAPANAQMYPGYGYDGWGWGHMIFGSLMMVVFWGGIILVVVLAVRWLSGGVPHKQNESSNRSNALAILKERFAKGEIDKEEFEERKRLLSD